MTANPSGNNHQLCINPEYLITVQDSVILLHSVRLAGNRGIIKSITSAEAILLALADGTRGIEDICALILESGSFSDESITDIRALLAKYREQDILIDPDSLDPGVEPPIYNPLDFAFEAKVKADGERLNYPISFTFLPTLRCNRHCGYCFADADGCGEKSCLTHARLLELLDETQSLGIRSVNISGGEPFLREDMALILTAMLRRGVYPTISTKAEIREADVEKLAAESLEEMQVSLDSHDPVTADQLAGSPGFFRQITTTIERLRKYSIRIEVNCVVTSKNIRHIPRLAEFLSVKGASRMILSPYTPSLGRNQPDYMPSKEDLEWLVEQVPDLKKQFPDLEIYQSGTSDDSAAESIKNLPQGPICSVGIHAFVLLPDGDIALCERLAKHAELYVGEVRTKSIMQMWTHENWNRYLNPGREKYHGTECFCCEVFDDCTKARRRCIVDSLAAYSRTFGPQPSCPRVLKYFE